MSYINQLKQRKGQGEGMVRSDPTKAMKTVLEGLPVRKKNLDPSGKPDEKLHTEAKKVALEAVLSTVTKIDPSKLPAMVKGLNEEEVDTLMKFIYKGFESTEYDYAVLLRLHDELCKVYGNGPIIRTIYTQLEV